MSLSAVTTAEIFVDFEALFFVYLFFPHTAIIAKLKKNTIDTKKKQLLAQQQSWIEEL